MLIDSQSFVATVPFCSALRSPILLSRFPSRTSPESDLDGVRRRYRRRRRRGCVAAVVGGGVGGYSGFDGDERERSEGAKMLGRRGGKSRGRMSERFCWCKRHDCGGGVHGFGGREGVCGWEIISELLASSSMGFSYPILHEGTLGSL
ncbi:hypothetical protein LOK49_LG04G01236 [Camellia lanceoleosa]|uniref:Uncharacterized protein n=1 Tax=Camellia lanceoleosa TaxID=1840588 RepID=A0ACC0I2M7_9ERIC|nr:hypothetical protein LOK49_LG04G01236 [Camellia lanceoleosa]